MTKNSSYLPDFLHKPICLFWAGILPQAILAVLNLRAWILVQGEASQEHASLFAIMGGSQLALLLTLTAVLIACRVRGRLLGWLTCVPLFIIHLAYLWFITRYVGDMLPREVTGWMLPHHVHLFSQFALVMPATFYFAARSACFPLNVRPLKDMGITAGALVIIPVLWYIIIRVLSHLNNFGGPEMAWVLFWVVSTVLTVMAFLRLLMCLYGWTCRVQRRRWIFIVLAAVAAPIAGLSLNALIPFPVDLQYPAIYVMTILNALVLLIPRPAGDKGLRLAWFARCAMLPFSLYFFLLFLPFLPLALPAMFAVGSGFLILAPTFLFAIHTQILIDEGKQVLGGRGILRGFACVIAAFTIIPGILTVDALIDRTNLNAAIDAVYTPDTLAQPRISASRAAKVLKRLDADKRGVYLPFVSGAYRQLVFDGMILPDHKIAQMYRVFAGEDLESEDARRSRADMFNFWTSHRGTGRGAGVRPPPRAVDLTSTGVDAIETNGMVRSTLTLTMTNGKAGGAEFITRMRPSPGVLVTGYWLEIEGVKKAGTMYEKRAAMWVYHMIRDVTRRDPGLLIYEDANTLKLNVFPFASRQTRVTGIEFLFPASIPGSVMIDDQRISLAPDSPEVSASVLLLESALASSRVLAIHPDAADSYQTKTRRPVINLLLDRSLAAKPVTEEQWDKRVNEIHQVLPEDALYTIAAVNHSTHSLNDTAVPFGEARSEITKLKSSKPEGGLAHHQAIRRGIARWRNQPVESRRNQVPMFVLLTAPDSEPTPVESISGMEEFTPDVTGYWIHDGSSLSFVPYDGGATQRVAAVAEPEPLLFPILDSAKCMLPGVASAILVEDPDARIKGSQMITPEAAQYIAGMTVWQNWYDTLANPSLLDANYKQLVNDSRSTGVMTPVTSFMVVENSAQEEMLKRKQKEAMNAKSALEFDEHQESPEPAFWLLLIPVMLLVGRRQKLQKVSAR